MSVGYRQLFIWVEGGDDLRFFDSVVKPALEDRYDCIRVRGYANQKKAKIKAFLRRIKAIGADCIFAGDINAEPCVTAKKERLGQRYGVESDRIIVVIMKI